jgi:hypothetical protein
MHISEGSGSGNHSRNYDPNRKAQPETRMFSFQVGDFRAKSDKV